MITLRKLAQFLSLPQGQGIGHPVSCVEIVSGSEINGIWPGKLKQDKKGNEHAILVTRGNADVLLGSFLGAMEEVIHESSDSSCQIPLAVELEPGPLSLVKDLNSLVAFTKAIEQRDTINEMVGFNLDLSHWILAGDICPKRLTDAYIDRRNDIYRRIFDRIIMAHFNDHALGHFGDVIFNSLRPRQNERWRKLFSCLMDSARNQPEDFKGMFSGFVSVEIEAALCPKAVESSYDAVRRFLS